MSITVVFYHGGKFVFNSVLEYEGGSETTIHEQDVDKWSYFEAVGISKDLGYDAAKCRLWWKKAETGNFRRLMTNKAAAEVANHAVKFKVEAHIYIEHFEQPGTVNEGTNEEEETAEEEDSEEELKGIHMDDSEEERCHGKDDGFGDCIGTVPTSQSTEASFHTPTRVNSQASPQTTPGGRTRIKMCGQRPRTPKKRNDASSSAPPPDLGQLSDGYVTDELFSSDPDEDPEERCKRSKYDRFKMEQLNKDYQFKVGLEFGSLAEFKDAIREWSIT